MTEPTTATLISDKLRTPITAQKRADGGVVIRGGRNFLLLGTDELDRLIAFVRNDPHIQRYPVTSRN